MKTYVLYHANCDDGFGAAWAAWKKLGDSAVYLPVKYGDAFPDMDIGSSVFIVDFSYPRDALESLAEWCKVVVLDHHKTAQEDLAGLPFAEFDMERSGAGMTWDHFFPGQPRPPLIDNIEDRDLWRFALPGTKQISSGLRSYPMDFQVWDGLVYSTGHLQEEGVAIERYIQRLVENLAEDVRIETWPEGPVLVVNAPGQLTSELADYLLDMEAYQGDQIRFVAAYKDMSDRRLWSAATSMSARWQRHAAVVATRMRQGSGKTHRSLRRTYPGEGTAHMVGPLSRLPRCSLVDCLASADSAAGDRLGHTAVLRDGVVGMSILKPLWPASTPTHLGHIQGQGHQHCHGR